MLWSPSLTETTGRRAAQPRSCCAQVKVGDGGRRSSPHHTHFQRFCTLALSGPSLPSSACHEQQTALASSNPHTGHIHHPRVAALWNTGGPVLSRPTSRPLTSAAPRASPHPRSEGENRSGCHGRSLPGRLLGRWRPSSSLPALRRAPSRSHRAPPQPRRSPYSQRSPSLARAGASRPPLSGRRARARAPPPLARARARAPSREVPPAARRHRPARTTPPRPAPARAAPPGRWAAGGPAGAERGEQPWWWVSGRPRCRGGAGRTAAAGSLTCALMSLLPPHPPHPSSAAATTLPCRRPCPSASPRPAPPPPPRRPQQEGSDDGPDFLSEEDRGVSAAGRR